MKKLTALQIGDAGELLAINQFKKLGYQIVKYGKEMRRGKASPIDIPVVSDNAIDCPFGIPNKKIYGENSMEFLDQNSDVPPYGKEFISVNLMVNQYIQRKWYSHNHNGQVGEFEGGTSHPGRYDFITFKDKLFSAVEVKVNSSKLNYWQTVRLSLLQRFGCDAYVLRVNLSKEQIVAVLNHETIESPLLNKEYDLDTRKVYIPSDDEFMEILDMRFPHEDGIALISTNDNYW